jgi:heparan-alpha-glucosaminide N-acetyltransferase
LLLYYAGGFFHGVRSLTFGIDMEKIRLMGILQVYGTRHFIPPTLSPSRIKIIVYNDVSSWLQRIAIAYIVTALCEIWLKGDDDVDSGFDLLKRNRYQL